MRWSKLRHLVKERFAEELQGRLDINSAAYGNCSCGHVWLTWDGEVIANFCTRANSIANGWERGAEHQNPAWKSQLVEFGELSRQDAYKACWAFLHELSIEEAFADEDPLVGTLAIADARIGKRRLVRVDPETLHPLVRKTYELRMHGKNSRITA